MEDKMTTIVKYSICMSCTHFDIYKKDNEEYKCKCDIGKKLIKPGIKCSNYKKAHKLPWWYREVSGFSDIKPFKRIHEERI